MKKIISAALLALQLTWKTAALIFLLTGLCQAVGLCMELMPGGVALQTTFGFETVVRSALRRPGMWWCMLLAIMVGVRTAAGKGSKTVYTMNRLGLSEIQMTMVFGAVFTGYFLLYWAFQLAVAYGAFVWYSRLSLVSSNALMLAFWRSEWLHVLLPLAEWWGWLRNIAICGCFGFFAAFGGTYARHGKWPLMPLIPAVICFFMLDGGIGNPAQDLTLAALLICLTVGFYFAAKEVTQNEDL